MKNSSNSVTSLNCEDLLAIIGQKAHRDRDSANGSKRESEKVHSHGHLAR